MITVTDILTQYQTLKAKIGEYYTLIFNEVNADATLDGLTSMSKTAEFNLWMWMGAALAAIQDSVWADRQKQIEDKINSYIPITDRWLHRECLKFQYGDSLLWDAALGKYYYPVIDPAKQIVARCAVPRSAGTTFVKVAKLVGTTPVAFSGAELTAFIAFVNQIQPAGARIATPVSSNSDKVKALMTVFYDGTKPLADIKLIVEAAWVDYLANLDFNGEYSINKHGDWVEKASADIKEVNMGVVEARTDAGAFVAVARVYNPVSGYLERDPAIAFDDMITYTAV